ncbi:hypothetical protein SBC1_14540 [Caballeronia sp. SBC1]|uniref:hypothetical protein n=1 Tax=unclassified Caballeronia TaxID=2646786 RepID=UPI0013E15D20|nr:MULTISPECIES: hypothetical protein [unclassified Caballeronia]QIE23567.1 hypothetical protein SBC2_15930 [Caballeronia sp. SBC2]QIN61462.1 hypothetical protein SBC1_14540 [Caballeronia sp. SBC1]
MTATKQTAKKTANTTETDVSELKTKIEAARSALQKALVAGDRTDQLRAYLRELEAEQQRAIDAQAATEAAKRVATASAEAEREARIREATHELGAARQARFAAIHTGLVPVTRSISI